MTTGTATGRLTWKTDGEGGYEAWTPEGAVVGSAWRRTGQSGCYNAWRSGARKLGLSPCGHSTLRSAQAAVQAAYAAELEQGSRFDLITRARDLGAEHRAEHIHPFGDSYFVLYDAGCADLLATLGVTTATTEDNAPERRAVVKAYCDALGGVKPS